MRLLVLGMHRSGTSLLVRTLEGLGLWAGDEHEFNPPTQHDPDGHREHRDVVELNEAALRWIDRRWDRATDIDWTRLPADRRADVLGAINAVTAKLDEQPDWVAKDPRLCLTLPLWREIVEPACIVVHRDPVEVARSLQARDGLTIADGIALWELYNRHAILNSDGLDRLLLSHADLVTAPERTTAVIDQWLAPRRTSPRPVQPPKAPVRDHLVRHRSTADEVATLLDPFQQRLLTALEQATDQPGDATFAALSTVAAERGVGPARTRD
jgi:hypothetical protein